MNSKIIIKTNTQSYPVIIENNCFSFARDYIQNKCLIVTDANVAPLYLDELKNVINDNVFSFIINAGEASKNKNYLFDIIDELERLDFNKSDTIIALGGGVVGDLTGLAAGLYMRGISLIMMPTTLLSMVDSSVGGKVAINHPCAKNMIGMFYQPIAVIASLHTLSTLSHEQILCGAGEIIKYGCIYDKSLFEKLYDTSEILNAQVIRRCIEIKNYYVTKDTMDCGERKMLNFGHTIGHCIEKDTGLLHGKAVALGMYYEAVLGEKLGITKKGTGEKILEILNLYKLPVTMPQNCDIKKYLFHDKKSNSQGITFALLKEIGSCVLHEISYDYLSLEEIC